MMIGEIMESEDYVRAILRKQETTNELLKYILILLAAVAVALLGARMGWWAFAVTVAN